MVRPEQSTPAVLAPPHTYGTPRYCSAARRATAPAPVAAGGCAGTVPRKPAAAAAWLAAAPALLAAAVPGPSVWATWAAASAAPAACWRAAASAADRAAS